MMGREKARMRRWNERGGKERLEFGKTPGPSSRSPTDSLYLGWWPSAGNLLSGDLRGYTIENGSKCGEEDGGAGEDEVNEDEVAGVGATLFPPGHQLPPASPRVFSRPLSPTTSRSRSSLSAAF